MATDLPDGRIKVETTDKFKIKRLVIDIEDGNSIRVTVDYGYFEGDEYIVRAGERIELDFLTFVQTPVNPAKNLGINVRDALIAQVLAYLEA